MVRGTPRMWWAISRISSSTRRRRARRCDRFRAAKRRGCCWRGSWRGEANLLVLDEPTNDLDVETLDLLQELLDAYDGTVLLVSHDRDFLDRVATTTVAMEGDGRATSMPAAGAITTGRNGRSPPSRRVAPAG
jgi:ABC-type cobalamin/Fe3+-siderophores transport system ATPase subunit